jgi:hypothetical protein
VVYGNFYPSNVNLNILEQTLKGMEIPWTYMMSDPVNYYYHTSVCTGIGDINADGVPDIALGYSEVNFIVVLFSGKDFAYGVPMSTIVSSDVYSSSIAISPGGDINGDGIDDFLIGNGVGKAYLVYGSATFASSIELTPYSSSYYYYFSSTSSSYYTSAETVTFIGDYADFFGVSIAGAGDVNNDGYDDILIGAFGYENIGAAYLIYGSNNLAATIDVNSLTVDDGFLIVGEAADLLGYSVAGLGDFNGDGYDDIAVGAFQVSSYAGATYVIFSAPKASISTFQLSTSKRSKENRSIAIYGAQINDCVGTSLSGGGDINNDGYTDLLIGAYYTNDGVGSAYLILGGDHVQNIKLANNPQPYVYEFLGMSSNSYTGYAAAVVGDINRDGYDDFIIGCPTSSNIDTGAAIVVFGADSSSYAFSTELGSIFHPIRFIGFQSNDWYVWCYCW